MPIKSTIHRVFCENVRARRMHLRLTQTQVAEMLGISGPAYNVIETGKCCPSIEQVDRVAAILRTTAVQLITVNAFKQSQKKSMFPVARN